jgi:hypothetical protein
MLSYEQRKLVYSRTPQSPCPSDIPLIKGERRKRNKNLANYTVFLLFPP